MKGKIFDIKHLAIHDGDGIRTTVFFKGCPLQCRWCHNPEGISPLPELEYVAGLCVGCAQCAAVCPRHLHRLENGKHTVDRSQCIHCGACVTACPVNALSLCYREITPEDLVKILLEDRVFYEQSGGGVTFSGGECLCQADFCAKVITLLKPHSIHCAIDTCGCVPPSAIDKVAPLADLFLYDIKHMDDVMHKQYTGQSNQLILSNLLYLDRFGKPIEVRIPVIPTVNDGMMEQVGQFLKQLHYLTRVKLLPYNSLAGSKYENLGKNNTMPAVSPLSPDQMEACANTLRRFKIQVTVG